ncbi:TonB-dependent receptor [Aureibacter tunicatorum]|uniref:Iron complex outermembrane receptor protein n=1 Tax=Aureibacter tunicatorum TaxID=866807 RepID=A0AAE3XMQ3_9BACT|nr:TonB-dependent receptor [Aureibacter tunicatorum]MDR6239330.1 iron complex outermembrane receptor protein [Aureibacter tunicatorum]BDD04747.1 TonB-dependent receptor [Aureibacter tunicatorum]
MKKLDINPCKAFILATILCLVSIIQLQAQNQVMLNGYIYSDTKQKEALENVAVHIVEINELIITDQNGYFQTNIPKGEYHLHIQILGYEHSTLNIKALKPVNTVNVRLKPDLMKLEEVIVMDTAKSIAPTLSITKVDETFMQKNMGNTLMNTLENKAGISTINTGTGISKAVIRGMTGNRIMVNENGLKQEGQQWGNDHGLEIDQNNVKDVDIIKGPTALEYGSDAIGGVININSSKAPELNTRAAEINSNFKSGNMYYGLSAMAEQNKEGKYFRLRASHGSFGNYNVPVEKYNYNHTTYALKDGILVNTGGRETSFNGTFGLSKPNYDMQINISNYSLLAGLFPGAYGTPSSVSFIGYDPNSREVKYPRQDTNHFKVNYNASFSLDGFLASFMIGYQKNNRKEESDAHKHYTRPVDIDTNLENGLQLETYSWKASIETDNDSKVSHKIGVNGQYQENERDGYSFLIPSFNSLQAGLFYTTEYKANDKLNLFGGGRIDYSKFQTFEHIDTLNYEPDNEDEFWKRSENAQREFFNWAIAIGAAYTLNDHFIAKLNLAKTYRVPNQAELSIYGVHHGTFRFEKGNINLDPEEAFQADLGISYNSKKIEMNFTPYLNYFTNFIYLSPTGDIAPNVGGQIYEYKQAKVVHTGFEYTIQWKISKKLTLNNATEYIHAHNFDSKLPVPFTPPFSNLSNIEYNFNSIGKAIKQPFIGIDYRMTAAQNRVDRNELSTSGYSLANFYTGFDFGNKIHGSFMLRVHNIFNTVYYNHLSQYRILNMPEQGRNISLSLTFKI